MFRRRAFFHDAFMLFAATNRRVLMALRCFMPAPRYAFDGLSLLAILISF